MSNPVNVETYFSISLFYRFMSQLLELVSNCEMHMFCHILKWLKRILDSSDVYFNQVLTKKIFLTSSFINFRLKRVSDDGMQSFITVAPESDNISRMYLDYHQKREKYFLMEIFRSSSKKKKIFYWKYGA